jgi:hypothetical protein
MSPRRQVVSDHTGLYVICRDSAGRWHSVFIRAVPA